MDNPLSWIDPLGLSPSGDLDKAMGGIKGDGLSAHHVIPVKTWQDHQPFLDRIGIGGEMNKAPNGIHIPGSKSAMHADKGKGINTYHSSKHTAYSDEVSRRIELIKRDHTNNVISDRQARDAIRKLQMDLKNEIWSGSIQTTRCKRMN